jgi:MYXO-CTERM domain-containing protein
MGISLASESLPSIGLPEGELTDPGLALAGLALLAGGARRHAVQDGTEA